MSFENYNTKETKLDFSNPSKVIVDHYEWLINQVKSGTYMTQKFVDRKEKNVFHIHSIDRDSDAFDEFSGDKEAYGDRNNEAAEYAKTNLYSDLDPKSITESDYIRLMREKMIAELNKCRGETLIHYENIKNEIDTSKISEDEFMRKIFGNRHCFILNVHDLSDNGFSYSPFSLYLFVLDFYLDKVTHGKLISVLRRILYGDVLVDKRELKVRTDDFDNCNRKFDMKSMLAQTLRSYIFGLFKKIELGVHVIQLSKQELQTITKAHLDYSTLFMDKIEVKIDPQMTFINNLSNLRSLTISYFQYGRAGEERAHLHSLSGLSNLEYLSLDTIKLHKNTFNNLLKLREIVLKDCDLGDLKPDVFTTMASLESFEAYNIENDSHINYLGIKKLKRLAIYDSENCLNFVKELPVDLRVLKIDGLSKEACQTYLIHPKIEILVLDSSDFTASQTFNPKWLAGLTNLKHLSLSDNVLKRVTLTNPVIQNLTSLSLKSNSIEKLNWNKLVNLKSLDLSDNHRITFESKMFDKLVNLEQLYLRSTGYDGSVKCLFTRLKSLRVLDLAENGIDNIDRETFKGLEELKEINLSDNRIKNIDSELITELFPNIEKMSLKSLNLPRISERQLNDAFESKGKHVQIEFY